MVMELVDYHLPLLIIRIFKEILLWVVVVKLYHIPELVRNGYGRQQVRLFILEAGFKAFLEQSLKVKWMNFRTWYNE